MAPHADHVYARVTRRLIPFLFLCYVCAYLDRVNVGFAKLRMLDDLGFSEAVYGLGAGIFFIGYFLFEVPSNLLMLRIGARRTLARIMIAWGVISAATMFVTTPMEFYIVRFLLGVAEAGFFPGVIFYLTLWYPSDRRGRVIALFATAVAISVVIGAPLSGLIMTQLDSVLGLRGWQWLFFLEAVPSVLMGLLALAYLDDTVDEADWLSASEKDQIRSDLTREQSNVAHTRIADGLRRGVVWHLALIYFTLVMGLYGLNFWLPTIIHELGFESLQQIGLLNAIPFGAAVFVMVWVGRSADRRNERRWHIVLPALLGAGGLLLSVAFSHQPVVALAALTLAACGIFSAIPQTWGLATTLMSGGAAAAGIALINSIGNLSGFVGPYAIGWVKHSTGSTASGILLLAGSLVVGALLVLLVSSPRTTPPSQTMETLQA